MTREQTQNRKSNMWQLWMLILLFALPAVAAWIFYFNPQWLPQGRTNHGTLIDPPRPVASLTLQTPEGGRFDWGPFKDQWTMTVVAEGRCDEHCIEQLIKVRQIRRAMAANRQRIERLLILLPDVAGKLELPSPRQTIDSCSGSWMPMWAGTHICGSAPTTSPWKHRSHKQTQCTTRKAWARSGYRMQP